MYIKRRTLSLALFMIFLFSMIGGSAAASSLVSIKIQDTAAVSISDQDTTKHIDLRLTPNQPSNLYASSTGEANVDYNGVISVTNETSPNFISTINNWDNSPVFDMWDIVDWMEISNDSVLENESFNVNTQLSINDLGRLSEGKRETFSLPYSSEQWCVIGLDLAVGVYQLFSYMGNIQPHIVSSDLGLSLDFIQHANNFGSGVSVFIFAVRDAGSYSLYLQRNALDRIIDLELKKYSTTNVKLDKQIEEGENGQIIYDVNEDVNPAEMPVTVYKLSMEAGDFVRLSFMDYFGNAFVRYTNPLGHIYELETVNLNNAYTWIGPVQEEIDIFIIVANPNFWVYDGGDAQSYRQNLHYGFNLEADSIVDYTIGTTKAFSVLPKDSNIIRIASPSLQGVIFNTTTSAGLTGGVDSLWQYCSLLDNYEEYTPAMNCPDTDHNVYLLRGTYYLGLTNPSTTDINYIEISSQSISINETLADVSLSSSNQDLLPEDMDIIDFEPLETPDGGQYLPKIFPYSMDQLWSDDHINFTWVRADNPSEFAENETKIGLNVAVVGQSEFDSTMLIPGAPAAHIDNYQSIGDSTTENQTELGYLGFAGGFAFRDDFESGDLNQWTTSSGNAQISTLQVDTGTYSALLRDNAEWIASPVFDLNGKDYATISYWVQEGSDLNGPPENGENCYLQYFDNSHSWTTLETFPADTGTDAITYTGTATLPIDAFHDQFQFRFIGYGTFSGDYWFVDNVELIVPGSSRNMNTWIIAQPYDVEINNASGYYRYNNTISLRAATSNTVNWTSEMDFGNIEQGDMDLNLGFDESPYNETANYNQSYSVNATEKSHLILWCNGTQSVDWYKMVIRSNNTSNLTVDLLTPDNPWISNIGESGYIKNLISETGPNQNATYEGGIVFQQFYLVIYIDVDDPNFPAQYWISIVAENTVTLSSTIFVPESGIDLGLALGLGFGIGIPVVLLAIWIVKKKKGGL